MQELPVAAAEAPSGETLLLAHKVVEPLDGAAAVPSEATTAWDFDIAEFEEVPAGDVAASGVLDASEERSGLISSAAEPATVAATTAAAFDFDSFDDRTAGDAAMLAAASAEPTLGLPSFGDIFLTMFLVFHSI